GTIVVSTAERKLYFVQEGGNALRYSIGVGRVGFQWKGVHKVSAKKEWPGWTPPPQMRARVRGLPAHMAGGEDNPLGARAMYLGSTLYRIHGSNDPDSIGQAESSGCFRMTNDDVKDLYERVAIGTTVIVGCGCAAERTKGLANAGPMSAQSHKRAGKSPLPHDFIGGNRTSLTN